MLVLTEGLAALAMVAIVAVLVNWAEEEYLKREARRQRDDLTERIVVLLYLNRTDDLLELLPRAVVADKAWMSAFPGSEPWLADAILNRLLTQGQSVQTKPN